MSKEREYKGHSIDRHIENYCVLDLETTGIFVNSADIIEISAIKVRNNQVIDSFSTLINPGYHIPDAATAVNHITDEMVQNAPTIQAVVEEFLNFVGDDVVIGYNNAGFDMNIIYDKVLDITGKPFSNDYIDVMHAVRRSPLKIENAKLETVSKYYQLDTAGEHRALKDCYLTKDCYDKLFNDFGDIVYKKSSHKSSGGFRIQFSAETLALQELQTILAGILEDGIVDREEAEALCFWVEEHRNLSGNYPFDKTYGTLDAILEDGVITDEELLELKCVLTEVVDPVKCSCEHCGIDTLTDKHVCITGDFDYGSRKDVETLIESVGGIIDKSTKKVTDYVVVGAKGSSAWKTGNYGSKIQKAMEYKNTGIEISIVEEKDFIPDVLRLNGDSSDK